MEDPDDDLADRPDRVGERLLAHLGNEPIALPLLGGEIEQVSRDALPDGREGAAWDLRDEVDDSLAELVDDPPRHAKVTARPGRPRCQP